jgi:hypothetical protein
MHHVGLGAQIAECAAPLQLPDSAWSYAWHLDEI